MGKKGGLVTLLRKDTPEIIAVHCHAHKLELAFKDVMKADTMYARLTTLLLGIYYFYKRSHKQRKCLKSTFKVNNKYMHGSFTVIDASNLAIDSPFHSIVLR